jgi:hypothetical protein
MTIAQIINFEQSAINSKRESRDISQIWHEVAIGGLLGFFPLKCFWCRSVEENQDLFNVNSKIKILNTPQWPNACISTYRRVMGTAMAVLKKNVCSILFFHFLGVFKWLTVHHFFIIGVLYRDAGSITLSVQAYERCLQIDPDSRNAGQVLFEVPSFDLLTFLQDSCLLVYDVLI